VVKWSDFEASVDDAFCRLSARTRDCNSGRDAVLPSVFEWRRLGERLMRSSKLRKETDIARCKSRAVEEPVSLICCQGSMQVQFQLQSESKRLPVEDLGRMQQKKQGDSKLKEPEAGVAKPVLIKYKMPYRARFSENVAADDTRRVMDALVLLEGQPLMIVEKKAAEKLTPALSRRIRLPIDKDEVKQQHTM
jgi:hypothetical protein